VVDTELPNDCFESPDRYGNLLYDVRLVFARSEVVAGRRWNRWTVNNTSGPSIGCGLSFHLCIVFALFDSILKVIHTIPTIIMSAAVTRTLNNGVKIPGKSCLISFEIIPESLTTGYSRWLRHLRQRGLQGRVLQGRFARSEDWLQTP
jgi:hypothetical protein